MANWTEQNLLALISNQQEEYLTLEFKRAGALAKTDSAKNEISKDVSAFANTIGGTILYGIAEANNPPSVATAIDPVDPNAFSKEWLEQLVNSRIQPRIQGILIDPIPVPTTRTGCFVYRVVIPESDTAHQAFDRRYYRRFNFQSVPMEDYEVRQAMFRSTRPSYAVFPQARTSRYSNGIEFFFHVSVLNQSEMTGTGSLLAYVPGQYFDTTQEHERVQVRGIDCVRLVGHTGANLPPGPTGLDVNRGLPLPDGTDFKTPIPVFFRIYDSFGLALFQRFSFVPETRVFTFEESIDVGRLASTIVP